MVVVADPVAGLMVGGVGILYGGIIVNDVGELDGK